MSSILSKLDYIQKQLSESSQFKDSKLKESLLKESQLKDSQMKDSLLSFVSFSNKIELPQSISPSLAIGDYVFDNNVKIINYIGSGSQAQVFLGYIAEIDKVVAVKHYELYDASIEEIEKITNEFEMIQSLSNRNIIDYFDSHITMNEEHSLCQINIVMEYVEMNLFDYLQKHKAENKAQRLPIEVVKVITRSILKGLDYLHKNSIIHRDLKPENILLSADLQVIKIADFGISANVQSAKTLFHRTKIGTALYMSPEAILGKPYAFDTDIWSLGSLVYEMASGMRPYMSKEPNGFRLIDDSQIVGFSSPLEIADEEVKDIFYDKSNRILLDFVQKCWRGNNIYRPTAEELLDHPFIKDD